MQVHHSEALEAFLARHPSFGGWREEWDGVPLEFRTCISGEIPPRAFVGSVRAIVLRDDEVLLVHAAVPILSVGGRCKYGETVEQTLLREVAEETGWRVSPAGVIGFIHCRHLNEQRPDWGRPAPDFIDPLFAVLAESFDASLKDSIVPHCEFVSINDVEHLGVEEINRTFLYEALRKRSVQ
ncbi:MAG TPA: NUDIX hydrolase [Abditibacteriaceae bacterium]|jgi:8-oxo-dGTP pyrophosphatase MutT (NUDIX family)